MKFVYEGPKNVIDIGPLPSMINKIQSWMSDINQETAELKETAINLGGNEEELCEFISSVRVSGYFPKFTLINHRFLVNTETRYALDFESESPEIPSFLVSTLDMLNKMDINRFRHYLYAQHINGGRYEF